MIDTSSRGCPTTGIQDSGILRVQLWLFLCFQMKKIRLLKKTLLLQCLNVQRTQWRKIASIFFAPSALRLRPVAVDVHYYIDVFLY